MTVLTIVLIFPVGFDSLFAKHSSVVYSMLVCTTRTHMIVTAVAM